MNNMNLNISRMKTLFSKRGVLIVAAAILPFLCPAQEPVSITPDGTYMFAQRDTCDLFLDVYEPAPGSMTSFEGKEKPTILFMFGGGFITGKRNGEEYFSWYKSLTDNGYRVIAIDYRLGLKGTRSVGIAQVDLLDNAIHIAVEDLFSATNYIIENAECLNVDPYNIVISGSSAGAITVLQADYELCNRTSYSASLPDDFHYAGVMSFSGGVFSRKGKLKYEEQPAPTIFFHGTGDKLVNYKQIVFFNLGFFGSDKVAKRFEKFGYNYNILRYLDRGHEIAGIMDRTVGFQMNFIEENIMKGNRLIADIIIDDPGIQEGTTAKSRKELYGN